MNNSSSLDILSILKVIWKGRVKFICTQLILFTIGFVSINLISKSYKCDATIKVYSKNDYDPINFFLPESNDHNNSELEASAAKVTILSYDFLSEIVIELNLAEAYEINSLESETELNIATQKLKSNLSIKDLQSNNMLQLKVSDIERNRSLMIMNQILNNYQKRKTHLLTIRNNELLNQLNLSIKSKQRKVDSITNLLSSIRTEYKIITNSYNSRSSSFNIQKDGFYKNYDLVLTFENELMELNKTLAQEQNKVFVIQSILTSNYPVFEVLEKPYLPLNPVSYNSPIILSILLCLTLILSIIFLFWGKY